MGQLTLTSFGHDLIVANAGQIPAITGSDKKSDPNDAENLVHRRDPGRRNAGPVRPIERRS
jgi:transposase